MSRHCVLQLGWSLGSKTRCSDAAGDQRVRHVHSQCRWMQNGMRASGLWCSHLPTFPSKSPASWSGTAYTMWPQHPCTGVCWACIRHATTVMWCLPAFRHIQGLNTLYMHEAGSYSVKKLQHAYNSQQLTQSVGDMVCHQNYILLYANKSCYFVWKSNEVFKTSCCIKNKNGFNVKCKTQEDNLLSLSLVCYNLMIFWNTWVNRRFNFMTREDCGLISNRKSMFCLGTNGE
jgi:hypothetical protein